MVTSAELVAQVAGLSRDEARDRFGSPVRSGDAGGVGLMAVAFSWDHFETADGLMVHVNYDGVDGVAGTTEVRPLPPPEPKSVELQVHADYYQFFVQDIGSRCDTSIVWDEPTTSKHGLAVGDGLVAVQTKRYGTVNVAVEWYPTDPGFQWEGIDRVSECGIVVTTQLGVGMPISIDPLPVIDFIGPGTYAVRAMASGLGTVENDSTGSDRYFVQLWPVDELPPVRHLTKPARKRAHKER